MTPATGHPSSAADGNGRVERALIHTVRTRRGLTTWSVLPVSLALATRQKKYIEGLTSYRFPGDPGSQQADEAIGRWVEVFAAACRRAVDDVQWLVREYNALIERYRTAPGSVRRGSTVADLLARLGELPVFTVALAAAHLDRSFEATNNAVARLIDVGALRRTRMLRTWSDSRSALRSSPP